MTYFVPQSIGKQEETPTYFYLWYRFLCPPAINISPVFCQDSVRVLCLGDLSSPTLGKGQKLHP